MAGDRVRVYQVIDAAAHEIVAKGEYSLTETYIAESSIDVESASFEVLRSRRDFKDGDVASALARAHRAAEIDPRSTAALVNLASLAFNSGDFDVAIDRARLLALSTSDAGVKGIADALVALIDSSLDGNVRELVSLLRTLINTQHDAGATHFEESGTSTSRTASARSETSPACWPLQRHRSTS